MMRTTEVAQTTSYTLAYGCWGSVSLAKSILTLGVIAAFFHATLVEGRIHHLVVKGDTRRDIPLSTFGFNENGYMVVNMSNFVIEKETGHEMIGLSLTRIPSDRAQYREYNPYKCPLLKKSVFRTIRPILFFIFDVKRLNVIVQCSQEWYNDDVYQYKKDFPGNTEGGRRPSYSKYDPDFLFGSNRRRRDLAPHDGEANVDADAAVGLDNLDEDDSYESPVVPSKAQVPAKKDEHNVEAEKHLDAQKVVAESALAKQVEKENKSQPELEPDPEAETEAEAEPKDPYHRVLTQEDVFAIQNPYCRTYTLPLQKTVVNGVNHYHMSFAMLVSRERYEGVHNLNFHRCDSFEGFEKQVSFEVDIEENNDGNYLSAGEMPLPALYLIMSVLFFLAGLFWVLILKMSKHTVYTIHYIMAVLVFLKSLSLMFHSINYHFIETRGEHVETWAILYYITHLLKGAVLIITILLIGTGWTFIKHLLSDQDKKVFMFVLPLQVLANVAEIIIEESEESDAEYHIWHNIFIFVDLLCCGAILFPIVGSIRHLHEASATDGKAAINLRKLKLFRQFYIMIVCYIYFTRIVVYLLKMTVSFRNAWLDEMFRETATYIFFIMTGYQFRPTSSHPYFGVDDIDNDDDGEGVVMMESGLTQGLHRTKAQNRNAPPTTTIIEGNDEENESLMTKGESSHEYD